MIGYTTHLSYPEIENSQSTIEYTGRANDLRDKTAPAPPSATFYALAEGDDS